MSIPDDQRARIQAQDWPTPREPEMTDLTVTLDPVDALFVVNELEQIERIWRKQGRLSRAEKLRRVREAMERAVYGGQTALERVETAPGELLEVWGK